MVYNNEKYTNLLSYFTAQDILHGTDCIQDGRRSIALPWRPATTAANEKAGPEQLFFLSPGRPVLLLPATCPRRHRDESCPEPSLFSPLPDWIPARSYRVMQIEPSIKEARFMGKEWNFNKEIDRQVRRGARKIPSKDLDDNWLENLIRKTYIRVRDSPRV